MDNLTHSLVGLALAETPAGRRHPHSRIACLVAANIPDVDGLLYLLDPDLALLHRRGHTHGILALTLWPVLFGLGLALMGRAHPRRGLWLLTCLAVWSHPVMDWFNTYGMRFLMPFDGRWFYGDTLFVVDPWLWLLLVGPLALARTQPPAHRRYSFVLGFMGLFVLLAPRAPWAAKAAWAPLFIGLLVVRKVGWRPRRPALLALGAAVVYVSAMHGLSRAGQAQVMTQLPNPASVQGLMLGPRPANPLDWTVVAAYPDGYHTGTWNWTRTPRLRVEKIVARNEESLEVRAARAAPCIQGLSSWARFPWYVVETTRDGSTVWMMDARYVTTRTSGFGSGQVELDRERAPRCDTDP